MPKGEAKRGRGRPRTPPDVIDTKMRAVCERIAKGELVKFAAKEEGTSEQRVREWGLLDAYSALYARARESQAHALAEQAIEIADGEDGLTALYEEAADAAMDAAQTEGQKQAARALHANIIARDRVRVDARKWLTSKIAPKLYGERMDVTTGGEPLTVLFVNEAARRTAS